MNKQNMTKCDFCTMSLPNGKCYWGLQASREDAIKNMVRALRKDNK